MAIDSAAALLVATVDTVAARAPAIVAAAARELGEVRLALHFGDGSAAHLSAEHSRLLARHGDGLDASVEVHFDDRSLKLLFDAERRPVDSLFAGSLDGNSFCYATSFQNRTDRCRQVNVNCVSLTQKLFEALLLD